MNDKPKSKWYWRLLRWGLIGLAVLTTLAAVLITEENWRGKHDWETYKRAAEARGERFDATSVVPPPVPDDQNFFCAPIVSETLLSDRSPAISADTSTKPAVDRMKFDIWRGGTNGIAPQINQRGDWQKATLTDLKQWQTAFRNLSATPEGKTNGFPVPTEPGNPAADVLLALSVYDPALEGLRQACERPYMRIPLNYDDDFGCAQELLPWLATMKRFTQFQELRIIAEEQSQQSAKAVADIKLLVRVNDCVREQPFLISQLVRVAIMTYVVQPTYEGLAQHCWSDTQLVELDRVLAKEDFLADYQFAMRGEKVFAIDTIEKQRITRETKNWDDSSGTNRIVTTSLRWTPAAFFYQNELCFAQLNDELRSTLVNMDARIVSPTIFKKTQESMQARSQHYSPYTVMALGSARATVSFAIKCAVAQAQLDLTRTACALERYHLAHGEYPASLDALTPQFIENLPHDVINGQPLHYHRTDDGRFVLYSVGLNEKDDGGTVVLTKSGIVDRDKGDWVWKYPAK